MEAAQLIADRAALERIIRQHEPELEEITYIDHGHDNLVVCVNKRQVFRFPRNNQAARRLHFELALLQYIKGKIHSLPTPEVVHISASPLYAITTYREGVHLTQQQIEALSEDEQRVIGRSIGDFMVEFTEAISGPQLAALRQQAGLVGMEEPWPEYFKRLFEDAPLPNDKLEPVVKEYYATWQNLVKGEQNSYAIHDDLHPANILFTGASISAILDFGDANVGSAEEEMRGLYRMGDLVLHAALDRYCQRTGRTISFENIRVWAIMNDLARFVRYLSEERTTHPAFLRAQTNLREWVPGFPL